MKDESSTRSDSSFILLHSSFGSGDGAAAVEAEDLTGDVGAFGDEEFDEAGDVVGRAGSRQGNALEVFVAIGLRVVGGPFDYAGGDAVDGDLRREGAGEAQRQVAERGLAGAIGE